MAETTQNIPSGTRIFDAGETLDSVYVLVEGALEVLREGRVVARLDQTPTYFGEMSMLLNRPATAEVRTSAPSVIMRIPREALRTLTLEDPRHALELAEVLAQRLDETTARLREQVGTWL